MRELLWGMAFGATPRTEERRHQIAGAVPEHCTAKACTCVSKSVELLETHKQCLCLVRLGRR